MKQKRGVSTAAFKAKFEALLASDMIMLDNVTSVTWRGTDGTESNEDGEGYFLVVVSPKSEDVYEDVRDHAVKKIRSMGLDLVFKADAQEVVVNGIKSAVFKATPIKA